MIFPPSGYGPNDGDGTDPKWTRWFAWFPVRVAEQHRAWMQWVECRLTPDGDPPDDVARMEFRLPTGRTPVMTFRGAIASLVLACVAVLGRVAGHARKKARHQ